MGCANKIVFVIAFLSSTLYSFLTATTVSSYPKDFKRHASPSIDWENGLKEAAHQALLREKYTNPGLHDKLAHAPIIGREDRASPFGDIAILARGQLFTTGNGFQFMQDPYQNDCIDCHGHRKCTSKECDLYVSHGPERLLALWTVKRIRHRDRDHEPRYELEYTISPVSDPRTGFITKHGGFDYNVPGHVFIVKARRPPGNFLKVHNQDSFNDKFVNNEPQRPSSGYGKPIPPPPLSDFYPSGQASTQSSVIHRPLRPSIYVPPDRLSLPPHIAQHYLPHKTLQNQYAHPTKPNFNYLPIPNFPYPSGVPTYEERPTPLTPIQEHFTLPHNHKQQIDIYKKLLDSLAQKTSSTKFIPIPTQSTYHRFKLPTKPTTPIPYEIKKTTGTTYHTTPYKITHPIPSSFHTPNIPSTIPNTPPTLQQIPAPQIPTSFIPIVPTYSIHPTHQMTSVKIPSTSLTTPHRTSYIFPTYQTSFTPKTKTTPQQKTTPFASTIYTTQNRPFTQSTFFDIHKTTPYITISQTPFKDTNTPTKKISQSTTITATPTTYITEHGKTIYFTQPSTKITGSHYDSTKPIPTFFIDPSHPGYPRTTPITPFTEPFGFKVEHTPSTIHQFIPSSPIYLTYPSTLQNTLSSSIPIFSTIPSKTTGTTLKLPGTDRYFPESTPHIISLPTEVPKPNTDFQKPTRKNKNKKPLDDDDDVELFPEDKSKPAITTQRPPPRTSPKPTEGFLLHEAEYFPNTKSDREVEQAIALFDKEFTTPKAPDKNEATSSKPVASNEIDELFQNIGTTKRTNKQKTDEAVNLFNQLYTTRLPDSTTGTPNTTARTSKIIYSDFYVASTTNSLPSKLDAFTESTVKTAATELRRNEMTQASTEPMYSTKTITEPSSGPATNIMTELSSQVITKTTTELSTSRSFSTSVSYEVNKYKKRKASDFYKNKTEVPRRKIKLVRKGQQVATKSDTDQDRSGPDRTLEDLALSVVNHAKSIDYLENKARRSKSKRKSHNRSRKIKKKED